MAFCANCGKELSADEKFCSNCGAEVANKTLTEEVIEEFKYEEQQTQEAQINLVPKCFTIFGKVGYIVGLVSFIVSFVPIVGYTSFIVGPVGIVFSILGKKDPFNISKCKKGLKLSIWGTILGFVFYILFFFILGMIGALQ